MAIRTKSVLKTFFETGDFPTQEQFADLIDSLRHLQEAIAIGDITDLGDTLNSFATTEQLNAAIPPKLTASINASTTINFSAPGLLRELVLQADGACTCTIRKNGDSDTDYPIDVPAFSPVLHLLSMPVYSGATLEILSPTGTITYTIYQA